MKIKNDIKWLKEKGFITEVKTPGALTTKSQLNKYVGQTALSSDIFDSKIKLSTEYLTFEFLENGNFSFSKDGLSYSLDNGTSWNALEANTKINISNGGVVMFKGEYTNTTASIGSFIGVGRFNVRGNIMSLLFGDNFADKYDLTGYNNAFEYMFQETNVVDASKLVLPATKLSTYCYGSMFKNCTSLTTAPELPATTITEHCYNSMFRGCTTLTATPELPATTLAENCYSYMFYGCSSLTKAPQILPALTLTERCYNSMFDRCKSLATAPELPATTLAPYCYCYMFYICPLTTAPEIPATTLAEGCCFSMFNSCSKLTTVQKKLPATTLAPKCYYLMFNGCKITTAPELPATELVSQCYEYMFMGCSKLNHIEAMFTTTPSYSYTSDWVKGVPSGGTFVKNAAATWDVTGDSGIPEGWTVETATV